MHPKRACQIPVATGTGQWDEREGRPARIARLDPAFPGAFGIFHDSEHRRAMTGNLGRSSGASRAGQGFFELLREVLFR